MTGPGARGPRASVGISAVIPTLNEAAALPATLQALPPGLKEVVVADGGSTDATRAIARAHGCRVVTAPPGRGIQMNAGADAARGDVLLFLHADTALPPDAPARIVAALADPGVVGGGFLLGIDARGSVYRAIAWGANLRTRLTGVFYGDQAPFVRAEAFRAVGGFPEVPLMEDVALGRSLKRRGRVAMVPVAVRTSARRWRREGPVRATLRNVLLMTLYRLGVAPERLARWYRPESARAPGDGSA